VAAEDLEEVTLVEGLGRVPFAVDVHAAQWGTTSRALSAVRSGLVEEAWAVDEHTALVVADGGTPEVVGSGAALHLSRTSDGVLVR
jgi:cyanophycinase